MRGGLVIEAEGFMLDAVGLCINFVGCWEKRLGGTPDKMAQNVANPTFNALARAAV